MTLIPSTPGYYRVVVTFTEKATLANIKHVVDTFTSAFYWTRTAATIDRSPISPHAGALVLALRFDCRSLVKRQGALDQFRFALGSLERDALVEAWRKKKNGPVIKSITLHEGGAR